MFDCHYSCGVPLQPTKDVPVPYFHCKQFSVLLKIYREGNVAHGGAVG